MSPRVLIQNNPHPKHLRNPRPNRHPEGTQPGGQDEGLGGRQEAAKGPIWGGLARRWEVNFLPFLVPRKFRKFRKFNGDDA